MKLPPLWKWVNQRTFYGHGFKSKLLNYQRVTPVIIHFQIGIFHELNHPALAGYRAGGGVCRWQHQKLQPTRHDGRDLLDSRGLGTGTVWVIRVLGISWDFMGLGSAGCFEWPVICWRNTHHFSTMHIYAHLFTISSLGIQKGEYCTICLWLTVCHGKIHHFQ